MTNKPQKVNKQRKKKKKPVKDRETLGFFWLSFVPGPGTTPNGPALYPWLKGHRNYLYLGYLTGFSGSLLVQSFIPRQRELERLKPSKFVVLVNTTQDWQPNLSLQCLSSTNRVWQKQLQYLTCLDGVRWALLQERVEGVMVRSASLPSNRAIAAGLAAAGSSRWTATQ